MAYEKFGSDVIIDMMRAYKIPYVSLNPGATYRGLHDSLVNYGKNEMPIITCTHEETAVQIAHGYAKASGKPMVAIVHDVVGLLHSCMAVFYTYLDRVPVFIMCATGPMDTTRRRPQINWIHTANVQGNAIRDYVKWDDQPYNAASIPESFARAYRVMMTEPKGPVYLCWDAGIQEDKLNGKIPLPNVTRLMPPSPIQGDLKALEKVAEMLVAAKNPVILTDYTGRNPQSFDNLVKLAELLAIPVVDFNRRLNFPTNHPLNLTGSDMIEKADLILSLDVRDLYGPLVKGVTVVPAVAMAMLAPTAARYQSGAAPPSAVTMISSQVGRMRTLPPAGDCSQMSGVVSSSAVRPVRAVPSMQTPAMNSLPSRASCSCELRKMPLPSRPSRSAAATPSAPKLLAACCTCPVAIVKSLSPLRLSAEEARSWSCGAGKRGGSRLSCCLRWQRGSGRTAKGSAACQPSPRPRWSLPRSRRRWRPAGSPWRCHRRTAQRRSSSRSPH